MELPLITRKNKAIRIIVLAGLVAGSINALFVIVDSFIRLENTPAVVFRQIAGSLLGDSALQGGTVMVVVGILLHFSIVTGWTALFFVLYTCIDPIRKHIVKSGILYGLFTGIVMSLVVLPLSNTTPLTAGLYNGWQTVTYVLYSTLSLGPPAAFVIDKSFSPGKKKSDLLVSV